MRHAAKLLPGRTLDRLCQATFLDKGWNDSSVNSFMFSAFVVTWLWHYRGTRLRVLSRNRKVENLADQLEMVARHAERVSLDPLCYCTLWAALLGLGKWEHVQPVAQRAPTFMFAPMRAYAKNCRDRARAFGKILRDHPPRWRRMMLDCLCFEQVPAPATEGCCAATQPG